jgi:L-rhamnose isomerase
VTDQSVIEDALRRQEIELPSWAFGNSGTRFKVFAQAGVPRTPEALLVDADALRTAQQNGDVLGANAVLMDAYNTDVRPLLAEVRSDAGLDPDPVAACRRSGYTSYADLLGIELRTVQV